MPSSTQEKQTQTQRSLILCVCYGFMISGACSQSLGPLIPFFRESYGFDYGLSGMLLSLQSIGNLATVLLAGILPTYLGRRWSVLLTGVWMPISYAILASGVSSPILVMLACLMTGLARGGNSTFANTMMSTLPGDMATKGFNISNGGFAMGALLSPILLLLLARQFPAFGWRVLAGVMCLLALSQFILYAKMPLPEEPPRKGVTCIDRTFLQDPHFWLGTAMLFSYTATEYAISGWLVTYFQDTGILSADSAQLMSTLFWTMMFTGRMVGGQIVGKIAGTRLLLIDGIGLLVCFLVMFFSRTPVAVTLALAGVGLSMATIYPTAFAFGSRSTRGNDFGCSLMSFMASIGGILMPAFVGFIAKKVGIQAGMGTIFCTVLLLVSVILLSISRNRAVPQHA